MKLLVISCQRLIANPPTLQLIGCRLVARQQGNAAVEKQLTAMIKMQIGLRQRLPLPISSDRYGPAPGCGRPVDANGDHALACARMGLLDVGPSVWSGHECEYPRRLWAHRRRLDLVICGAKPL